MTIEYLNNYLTKNKDLKDRSNFPKCWGPFVVDVCDVTSWNRWRCQRSVEEAFLPPRFPSSVFAGDLFEMGGDSPSSCSWRGTSSLSQHLFESQPTQNELEICVICHVYRYLDNNNPTLESLEISNPSVDRTSRKETTNHGSWNQLPYLVHPVEVAYNPTFDVVQPITIINQQLLVINRIISHSITIKSTLPRKR